MSKPKFPTALALESYLSTELTWRRKELSELKRLIKPKSLSPDTESMLLRSGLAILYSHWEGFVKDAATAYIRYVANQGLKYDQLSPSFMAIALYTKLKNIGNSGPNQQHREFMEFMLNKLGDRSNIKWDVIIDTESNLSSKVFKKIVEVLGLPYLYQYETKQNMLDEKLLANRNKAAHGEKLYNIDILGFLDLYKIVVGDKENLGLLDTFKDQIITAIAINNHMK